MKKYLLYLFLIVISNPYEGIDYNKVNVYDVNYCSDYCYNQNDSNYAYFDDEEEQVEESRDIEELEDEYRDEFESDKKRYIFPVDFLNN